MDTSPLLCPRIIYPVSIKIMNENAELKTIVSSECPPLQGKPSRKGFGGKPGRSGPPGNKNNLKHGYYSLVKLVKSRHGALDKRTILGKMVVETVRQLETDLGGDLSTAQRMLVRDVAIDTLLLQA